MAIYTYLSVCYCLVMRAYSKLKITQSSVLFFVFIGIGFILDINVQ